MEVYSHFKKAGKFDGNVAYFHLREDYIFSSQVEGALLLQKLNGFILQSGERLTTFCTRLAEVFQELEDLDGEHAMTFTDTQKLTYLLNAIHHEPHLEAARVYLQSEMNRGTMTYGLALRDLRLKDETKRAEEAFDTATPRLLGTKNRDFCGSSGPRPDSLMGSKRI